VLRFRGLPHADGAVVLCGAAAVQAKGLATRVRKQFDDLRIQVKEKTREIQEVQAELRILDKMVFADRTHDAVRMSSELDLLTDKFVLVAVGLCVGPRICLCLCLFSNLSPSTSLCQCSPLRLHPSHSFTAIHTASASAPSPVPCSLNKSPS
jgi:hypothetical protein